MRNIFEALRAEFPRPAISWRAQTLNKEGTKAMALAYIDARDVMQRLDDVLEPDGWQCRYPHANGKTVCEIGIRVGEEWIWKADGAGDTDIEAEKGALSDAFKRSAVRWGIGRYLYDLASPWVPCKSYQRRDGKLAWSEWTADPWSFVRNNQSAPMVGRNAAGGEARTASSAAPLSDEAADILVNATIEAAKLNRSTDDALRSWWTGQIPNLKPKLPLDHFERLKTAIAGLAQGEGRAAA